MEKAEEWFKAQGFTEDNRRQEKQWLKAGQYTYKTTCCVFQAENQWRCLIDYVTEKDGSFVQSKKVAAVANTPMDAYTKARILLFDEMLTVQVPVTRMI